MVIYCCHRNRLFCSHKHSFVFRSHPAFCHLSFHSAKGGEVMEGGKGGGSYWEWGLSLQLPSHTTLHTVAGIWFVLPVVSKVRVWCLSCTQEFALLLYWLYLLPPILISQWFSAGWMWQEILGPGVSVGPLWNGLPPCAGECWPITLASFRGPLDKP